MIIKDFIGSVEKGGFDGCFRKLYGGSEDTLKAQRVRYIEAAEEFARLYPEHDEISVYSAPGRTEVGGNHTDHQHGCVLAAAVNLDVIAIVAANGNNVIRLKSKGYPEDIVELSDLSIHEEEKGRSASIIRGIAARFSEMGVTVEGFDAYTTSEVLSGSGLSSSAAFEVLVGNIIDRRFNSGRAGAVEIAKIGQYAENVYFGKGSGLMDQMVSSVGGFVFIDFNDTASPVIESREFDFEKAGYCLCITDTKGSHSDLTDDYVAVPVEMKSVAKALGGEVLRQTDENAFYEQLPVLRNTLSDRAILRAAHFFGENARAALEAEALDNGNIMRFFELVRESGDSSANLLQNLYSCKKPHEQGISVALMMSRRILCGKGACRVHGGGFAGTVQAFVPLEDAEKYSGEMNRIFGEGSCYVLSVRPVGGVEITAEIN